MIRKIIHIDEEKCNGCGICAKACHEGAIDIVNGKAKLARENFCDGFGDCLPGCPMDAISFEEREAPEYDEAAVQAAQAAKAGANAPSAKAAPQRIASGFANLKVTTPVDGASCPQPAVFAAGVSASSEVPVLLNWPVQIKLAPLKSPAFENQSLLIAADCTGFSYPNFYEDFIKGHVCLIGCPKLDAVNYAQKLTEILRNNNFTDITLTRMTVPCCGGMTAAVQNALQASGKDIPLHIVTLEIPR